MERNVQKIPEIVGNTLVTRTSVSFRATNLFITWPQCEVDKQETGKLLLELYDPMWVVVAEEAHADGAPHLHAILKCRGRTRFYHDDLDRIVGKHGNYQKINNLTACLTYIAKDKDFYANGKNMCFHCLLLDLFEHKINLFEQAKKEEYYYNHAYE